RSYWLSNARNFFKDCRAAYLRSDPNILYPDETQVLHSLPTKMSISSTNFCLRESRFRGLISLLWERRFPPPGMKDGAAVAIGKTASEHALIRAAATVSS